MSDPVADLREAAALMRERAESVPSPWVRSETQVHPAGRPGWVIFSSGVPEWGDYLQSWHPGVALAVADWLETVAVNLDLMLGGSAPRSEPVRRALAVARAYLGTAGVPGA
jgi:hypothetical protein